jgi:hypothetical protein
LFWPATITPDRLTDNETYLAEAISNGANPDLAGCIYEDAVSFASLPPNIPIEEERFVRSKATATGWIDKIARQSQIYSIQGHFAMAFGKGWATHDNTRTRTYPFHQWTEIFNQHCKGECREVSTISCPTRDVTVSGKIGSKGDGPHSYTDVPEIGCHIFKDGTKWAAIVTNRNLPYDSIDSADPLYDASDSGSREVQVSVDSGSYTLKKYTMSGAWNAHNFDAGVADYDGTITVSETSLGANNGTISDTIPAAEAVVYVWEA